MAADVKVIRIHTCDVCGKRDTWGPTWRSKLCLHRRPVPWDETIKCCSAQCVEMYEKNRKAPEGA